jgi:hypothetical protein
LSSRYLAFVSHAFNADLGRFRNFMGYSRQWLEASGSEDSHGRTLWALGAAVGRAREPGVMGLARQLFHAALPAAASFESPRAWAFTLLGVQEYLRAFGGDRGVETLQTLLSDRLMSSFKRASREDWPWCEDALTYENGRLPQALIASGLGRERPDMVETGLEALSWLTEIQCSADGDFAPIGSNGFFSRGGECAQFDQQPVEACATVSACLEAWRATRDDRWPRLMWAAFNWFLGENSLQTTVYDPATGGCRDGLHPDRANENQGAESTLSFLLALSEMRALDSEMRLSGEHVLPENGEAGTSR